MTFKVKPEIRTLSLTGFPWKGRLLLFGVVFRGNLWVDGVLKGTVKAGGRQLLGLNRMVKGSSH
ncbi:hypothetical protein DRO53_04735, partial [Candidatus Bathyarchaeota archaeon]